MAGPTPSEVKPWYLRNITEALYLDSSDQVTLRTGFTGNISIGNVTLPGNIAIDTLGNVDITGNTMPVTGNVGVTSLPPITGNVSVANGNITVAGAVSVTNFPATQTVNGSVNANITGGNVTVGGTVSVSNFPATQPVSGTVNANVLNFPAVYAVENPLGQTLSVDDGGGVLTVDGTVNAQVTNWPAVLPVDNPIGQTLSIDDAGGSITVDGTVTVATLPPITGNVVVTGNVVANVTGNVAVTGGNVNAAVTGTVAVSSVSGNVTVVDGGGSLTIDGNVNATIQGVPTVSLSSTQTDAFGRLRVSNPYTLFDSHTRYYDHDEYSNAISGGSVTYNSNSSTFDLTVAGAAGNSVIRESRRVFPYQPGKSLLIFSTFCMGTLVNGLTQRVGFYGAQNGIYFEVANNTLNMVIRSFSSGSLVEERVPQTSWNGDQLDGAGPSGITLDVTKTQIFWIDVEWLGVGSVRTGFVINGTFYTAHTFHHANLPGNTTTYMTTATLPLRYEITNTAAVGFSSTLRQICQSVISEGGYVMRGDVETAGTGINTKRLVTAGTYYPVASIRLAPGRTDAVVAPSQVDILSPTVNYYRWVLLLNPTLTGASWVNGATGSVQYDVSATAVSGGLEIESGYVSSRELSELGADFFNYQLGRSIAGVSDIVTLAMTATNNNADVLAQLGWTELS